MQQECFGKGTCECKENGWQCKCQPGHWGKYCQFKKSKNVCKRLAPCVFAKIANDLQMPDDELKDYENQCKEETYYNNKPLFGKDFKLECTCSENQVYRLNFDQKCTDFCNNKNKDTVIKNDDDNGNDNGNDNEITMSINSEYEMCLEEYAGCNIHFKYLKAIDKDAFYKNKDQGGEDVIYIKYIKK